MINKNVDLQDREPTGGHPDKEMEVRKYSELRDLARPSIEGMLPLPFPLSLHIEPTNRCIFKCRYCPVSLPDYAHTVGPRMMTLEEFDKIARDIKAVAMLKVLRFYFMGEPLLNPQLPNMIELASSLKLAERTELTTNAVLLDAAMSRTIVETGLDYLRVSISSIDPIRHKQITQSSISVEAIYSNIKNFKAIRDELGLTKPVLYVKLLDPFDQSETSRFLEMYQNIADEAVIEMPMNWDGYGGHDLIEAAYGRDASELEKDLYPYPKEVCPFPFYTLAICANGDVTVCCVDWNKATKVGNVYESDLKSIWDGEDLRELRRMHVLRNRVLNQSCRNCTFLYTVPDNLDNMSESIISSVLDLGKIQTVSEKKCF